MKIFRSALAPKPTSTRQLLWPLLALLVSHALAAPTLVQTLDLGAWAGTPVTIVQPPPPQPAPGFSVTGIAYDPVIGAIYVSDYASTNVYTVDAKTNSVASAVSTNGLYTIADIGPTQDVPGTAPTVVLANPLTNNWMFTGELGGAEFNGTIFVEPLTPRAMQSGAAWDPVTGNVYAADGLRYFATNNAKFLLAGGGPANAVAVHGATSRVYFASGASLVAYDGFVLSKASVKIPTTPLATIALPAQTMGLAIDANTNRIYIATGTAVEVLDASTYQHIASISGLPDQSAYFLVAGYMALPLPRPITINTATNTIFVVNSITSTISVIDGATNTVTATIAVPVPDGAIVTQPFPLPATTLLSELKPGNTYFDSVGGSLGTLGGAIASVVNEADNQLYVATVNGEVYVYALDPAASAPAFSVNGFINNPAGIPVGGVTVSATGTNGSSTAVSDSTGLFVLTGLPAGTYTVKAIAAAYSFAPNAQSVVIVAHNVAGLAFTANPPIVPVSYALSPWTLVGPGVATTGSVTLSQPAPLGGAQIALSSSDAKSAKFPSTVTVTAGQSAISFTVQGNGVSAMTTLTLSATYNGGVASTALTVAPGDSVHIISATYSKSQQVLQVKATSTNSAATMSVQNANTNTSLGAMNNLGGGNYSFQLSLATGVPTSVNVSSNLGGKTGQGVTIVP
jgi:DNA-binding beta-propeller fold protein YncE